MKYLPEIRRPKEVQGASVCGTQNDQRCHVTTSVPKAELYVDWDKMPHRRMPTFPANQAEASNTLVLFAALVSSQVYCKEEQGFQIVEGCEGCRCGDTVQVNTGRCSVGEAWTKHGRRKCKGHA
ncbi:hypothetical protein KY290_036478 [Solanum tuberosum]|uniref:Uncharacterized protein n=1 Tax=Solanum tuberosum TaxID=4113 RepID=A0ABQ7TTJ8_SOLTU|nr:hypothetical protein KY289_035987 [Solanum tuberosum]KAH0639185.1 hypothetical protein KY285_035771 [Solanum tuberosum]KAH0737773.1 hypothetical protein KY290_036478 [Solanum tuberosum]